MTRRLLNYSVTVQILHHRETGETPKTNQTSVQCGVRTESGAIPQVTSLPGNPINHSRSPTKFTVMGLKLNHPSHEIFSWDKPHIPVRIHKILPHDNDVYWYQACLFLPRFTPYYTDSRAGTVLHPPDRWNHPPVGGPLLFHCIPRVGLIIGMQAIFIRWAQVITASK